MRLKEISKIQSGYISRGKIEHQANGSHYILQARDVDADRLTYQTADMTRFSPNLSAKDRALEPGDLLFMARGPRNYSVLIKEIPARVLAAACFFIIRVTSEKLSPDYLFWYLNQEPVDHFLRQHSGRGVHMPVVRRSVLEDIHIPVPPAAVQDQIASLNTLLREEIELIRKLGEKRREMITTACMQAVRDNT
ncbi:MAG: restriction endonuclease subunit S [Desulfobacteraceae bacterium]|nr:restriction endonuclease subunit S [Desulfobacteraceae bacterium]